jgi:hypothetical protein
LQFLAIDRQFLVDHPKKSIALVDQLIKGIDRRGSEKKQTFFTSESTANPLTRPASEN